VTDASSACVEDNFTLVPAGQPVIHMDVDVVVMLSHPRRRVFGYARASQDGRQAIGQTLDRQTALIPQLRGLPFHVREGLRRCTCLKSCPGVDPALCLRQCVRASICTTKKPKTSASSGHAATQLVARLKLGNIIKYYK
jgi:hypothetical protein